MARRVDPSGTTGSPRSKGGNGLRPPECGTSRRSCAHSLAAGGLDYGRAIPEPTRTVLWHGPGPETDQDCSDISQTVPELLTRFGSAGWELVALQEHCEGGMSTSYWDAVCSIVTYTFKTSRPRNENHDLTCGVDWAATTHAGVEPPSASVDRCTLTTAAIVTDLVTRPGLSVLPIGVRSLAPLDVAVMGRATRCVSCRNV